MNSFLNIGRLQLALAISKSSREPPIPPESVLTPRGKEILKNWLNS